MKESGHILELSLGLGNQFGSWVRKLAIGKIDKETPFDKMDSNNL